MLTHRQLEVENLLLKGYINKQIGTILGIEERTVKAHTSSVYSYYNVTNYREFMSFKYLELQLRNKKC